VACGVGAVVTATVGTAMFSAVAIYLQLGPFGSRVRYDGVLRFRVPTAIEPEVNLDRLLDRHCLRQVLLSVGEMDGLREHVYQVKFFRLRNREELLVALRDEMNAQDAQLMLQDATAEY
jgi:hypothetical protein